MSHPEIPLGFDAKRETYTLRKEFKEGLDELGKERAIRAFRALLEQHEIGGVSLHIDDIGITIRCAMETTLRPGLVEMLSDYIPDWETPIGTPRFFVQGKLTANPKLEGYPWYPNAA